MTKNYKELLKLHHEFNQFLSDIHGIYLDSILGSQFLFKYIEKENDYYRSFLSKDAIDIENLLDSLSFNHSHIMGKEFAASGIHFHFTNTGKVKDRNLRDGKNQQYIGKMCIVFLHSFWENHFRKELSDALGINKEDLLIPLWGDITIIRNCILHKKHLDKKGARKIQVFNWFKEGDEIVIDENMFRQIIIAMLTFSNWIHSQSLPKRGITIKP